MLVLVNRPTNKKIMNVTYDNLIETVRLCSGGAGTGPVLFDYWNSHNCPLAYQMMMGISSTGANGLTGIVGYSVTGANYVRDYIVQLFNNYEENYLITNNVSDPRYNNFQRTLLNLCLDPALPGACEYALDNFCAVTNRTDLAGNLTLTNFCGCFVASDPLIDNYIGGTSGCFGATGSCQRCDVGQAGCKVIKACDQLCHRSTTVQRANLETGRIISCPEDVCVINDVIIDAENTSISKGINFTSICGGCQGFGCYCIVSGINISETAASVGLAEDFNQFCGTGSVCIEADKRVPCSEISSSKIPIKGNKSYPSPAVLIALGVVLLIIIIFIIFTFV